ncbi:MAG: phospholipase D family protein [Syntrophomonadaceae bacterium]
MSQNRTLFDEPESQLLDLFQEQVPPTSKIDVVQMDFVGADAMGWEELFAGFDRLYAITYSSGMGFIYALLQKFPYAEIIFGFDEVISYNLQEIMAYQLKTIERLKTISNQTKTDLLARIDNHTLKLRVAREKLSHEKIYLLEADDGRKRVVMGSANMSYAAFSGKQRENVCYVDGERAFDWYKQSFDQLK